MSAINKIALETLQKEVKNLIPGEAIILQKKINSVIKEFNYQDVPIYNRLNELHKTLITEGNVDGENFNDIKGKLMYLIGQMLERF